jgi:hypothetical protein
VVDQRRELEQLGDAEGRAAGRDDDERVRRARIGPTSREAEQLASLVDDEHPIFAPGALAHRQTELTPHQRMKHMGDTDTSLPTLRTKRS